MSEETKEVENNEIEKNEVPVARPVQINPEGVYALPGATILAILQDLKGNIPITLLPVVQRVENALATAQPVQIQPLDGEDTETEADTEVKADA